MQLLAYIRVAGEGGRPAMRIILVALCMLLLLAWAAQNDARAGACGCPTVKARGHGSTDCVTSESSGLCTIDYNRFDSAMETRAISLVAKSLGRRFDPRFSDQPSAEWFNTLRSQPSLLRDTVLATLGIAAIRALDEKTVDEKFLLEAFGDLDRAIPALDAHFFSMAGRGNDIGGALNKATGLVTGGCIEVKYRKLWLMYKARWSAVPDAPNCGGPAIAPDPP
jgi:hypothetical protein